MCASRSNQYMIINNYQWTSIKIEIVFGWMQYCIVYPYGYRRPQIENFNIALTHNYRIQLQLRSDDQISALVRQSNSIRWMTERLLFSVALLFQSISAGSHFNRVRVHFQLINKHFNEDPSSSAQYGAVLSPVIKVFFALFRLHHAIFSRDTGITH